MNFKYIFTRVFIVIVLAFIFFVAGGGISQNDRWRIDRIQVMGTNESDQNSVIALVQEKLKGNYFFIYARENSFLFPKQETERALLDAFPRFKGVELSRTDDHTLSIVITERVPFILWCGEKYLSIAILENCWFMDDTGFVFERAPIFSPGVYLEVYGSLEQTNQDTPLRGILIHDRFAFAISLMKGLQRESLLPLRIFVKPDGEYGIVINSSEQYPILHGTEILFKDGEGPSTLMDNLLAALHTQFLEGDVSNKKLSYIDLRFGNKVFFGFEK